MIKLSQAKVSLTYFVAASPSNSKLRDLGFVTGKKVELLNHTATNAIVLISGTRLAIDKETLDLILVEEKQLDEQMVDLSDLKPGETGIVRKIETDFATKHRLMDMGVTRGVGIFVRKLAPLGDPMELHLRGYSLSLRKQDASLIKVAKERKNQS
ncbi:MAG: ferrous iron transport protein A [Streptococcaceae bacterium]|jgi:ferrous iron transport protein A|nr:ferrous iron transport protein A [Streptococcaceae bacterium]